MSKITDSTDHHKNWNTGSGQINRYRIVLPLLYSGIDIDCYCDSQPIATCLTASIYFVYLFKVSSQTVKLFYNECFLKTMKNR